MTANFSNLISNLTPCSRFSLWIGLTVKNTLKDLVVLRDS